MDSIFNGEEGTWAEFFWALEGGAAPTDFLDSLERDRGSQDRDPFADDGA